MTTIMKSRHEFQKSLPPDTSLLDNQVAGHSFKDGKNSIGMLKQKDGNILKPASKEREITFYENIFHPNNLDIQVNQLRQFIPLYSGIRSLQINQKDIKFMVLENLTKDMRLPCVMDIKIGKITWDIFATPEKIACEKKKYAKTKNELGLSLPGFEVFDLSNRILRRYRKDHGMHLNPETFKESLKIFLNGTESFNKHLIFQILGQLWRILDWFRNQRKLLFFSSSILLVYDAYRLRKCQKTQSKVLLRPLLTNPLLSHNLQNRRRRVLYLVDQTSPIRIHPQNTERQTVHLEKLWHNNAEQFQYDGVRLGEKELSVLKEEYFSVLQRNNIIPNGDLMGSNHHWVKVKMIDFAHVFPSMEHKLDENYLEGLEKLVKIFEEFLLESYQM